MKRLFVSLMLALALLMVGTFSPSSLNQVHAEEGGGDE